MPGPPPKDPALRRRTNATPGFKLLPHEGRRGATPAWPLSTPDYDEAELWEQLWKLPQAVEWERMRCERDVARYVRYAVRADEPGAEPKLSTEVRQLDAKIGVSPKAMRDLRWETDEPTPEEPEAAAEGEDQPEPPKIRAYVPKAVTN